VCFYKRTWRLNALELEREGDIALRLQAPDSHTPTLGAHEDIDEPFHTRGISAVLKAWPEDLPPAPWINHHLFRGLRDHSHYHLVLEEVCRPLNTFCMSKEAVGAIRDAVKGT
jgi:hypothetical protein